MSWKKIKLAQINPEQASEEIGDFIVETVLKANAVGGVIGLSAGVDSTTTAALAKKAFDEWNQSNAEKMELVAFILPSKINNSEDTAQGIEVAKKLGLRFEVIDIEPIIHAYACTNPKALENNFHKGNLIARIRANVLSTKAATEKKLVIGTGNKDEDFGVGYFTLFGDGAVHLNPIGNLSKRHVREMAVYLGFEKIAEKEPAAGLEPGQTDFRDLGYRYNVVELVTEGIQQGFSKKELIESRQIFELIEPQMESSQKFNSAEAVVEDILRRHLIAQSKAKIIHPPAAKITLKY